MCTILLENYILRIARLLGRHQRGLGVYAVQYVVPVEAFEKGVAGFIALGSICAAGFFECATGSLLYAFGFRRSPG